MLIMVDRTFNLNAREYLILNTKPGGKRGQGKSRLRWIDRMKMDLRTLDCRNWMLKIGMSDDECLERKGPTSGFYNPFLLILALILIFLSNFTIIFGTEYNGFGIYVITDIIKTIKISKLRWTGHIMRTPEENPVKTY